MTPLALSIAGSDSCGGAGLQADLAAFAALGVRGATAVTAVTAQNRSGVRALQVLPALLVRDQIDAVFEEEPVRAVKLGMLAEASIIEAVAASLRQHRARGIGMFQPRNDQARRPPGEHFIDHRLFPVGRVVGDADDRLQAGILQHFGDARHDLGEDHVRQRGNHHPD